MRRPSGAFATLDASALAPGCRRPLPVEVRHGSGFSRRRARATGAAPASPMPAFARRAPGAPGDRPRSSSIFTPRPAPPAACARSRFRRRCSRRPPRPTSTRRCRSSRRRAARRPRCRDRPAVIPARSDDEAIQRRPDARVRCGGVLPTTRSRQARCCPRPASPTATEGDGELTQRRSVDPVSGDVTGDVLFDATGDGEARQADASAPAATLDAPLASLIDSGAAPPCEARAPATAASRAPRRRRQPDPAEERFRAARCGSRPTGQRRPRAAASAATPATSASAARSSWALAIWSSAVKLPSRIGPFVRRERAEARGRGAPQRGRGSAPPGGRVGDPRRRPTPPAPETATRCRRRSRGADRGRAGTRRRPAKTAPPKPEEAAAKTDARPTARAPTSRERQGRRDEEHAGKHSAAAAPAKRGERDGRPREARRGAAPPKKPAADKAPAARQGQAAETADAESGKAAEGDKRPRPRSPPRRQPPPARAGRADPEDHLFSPPGAEVVIDGVPVGTTPFSSKDVERGRRRTRSRSRRTDTNRTSGWSAAPTGRAARAARRR